MYCTAKQPLKELKDSEGVRSEDYLLSPFFSHEPELSLCTKDGFRMTSAGFVVVYTDGSCLNNGKLNPIAAVGVYFGPESPHNISQTLPDVYSRSNNVAEIVASLRAFRLCRKYQKLSVEIRTDSKFLIRCMLLHLPVWKTNGWKKTNGKPVHNKYEFELLDKAIAGMRVRWIYVPAHSGEAGNGCADFLARLATFKVMRQHNPLYFHSLRA